VQGLFDDFTPRAVWLEYGARKRAIADAVVRPHEYDQLVEALSAELGCGVAPEELSAAQQRAQEAATRKWGGR
jgi:hypothetical protein